MSKSSNGNRSEIAAAVQKLTSAAIMLQNEKGRFASHHYLKAVYSVYWDWRAQSVARKYCRLIAAELMISERANQHLIRTLIEASAPALELRIKSRWTRALEFAFAERTTPAKLKRFLRAHGGIAGCAVKSAERAPKRNTFRDDWN
ncbi:MAG: hypothetical protein HY242_01915 [Afipia sp.]|nr:hypothetical protein [Afipia sp.]